MSLKNKKDKIPKTKGLKHLTKAIIYAYDGFCVLSKETAFRHEVIFLLISYGLFLIFGAAGISYFIMALCWFALIAAEAINTAIEFIVDRVSPEISEFAKHTKDLASFGVFMITILNIFYVIFAIYSAL